MKDLKLYLLAASVLLIFYLVAQYNRPKAIDWSATLSKTDKIPFGTYVLYNRVNDIFPGAGIQTSHDPVYNVLNDDSVKTGTYIIICNAINLNKYDFERLKKFITTGNAVFIAANSFGDKFKEDLKIETRPVFKIGNKRISTTFLNESIKGDRTFTPGKNIGNEFFSSFDTAKAVVISKNSYDNSNYIKYRFGKGSLYLNANPLLFTNYNILHNGGANYVSTALSYLKTDKNLIWDEFYSQGRHKSESTMRVFLSNPALEMAFYISLFSILIFVLYDMKRRQRAIPVIEPLANSTVEFVNVVGQVYYEKRDNNDIANKKIHYLLENLREVYHLKTSTLDTEFVERLSTKLDIKPAFAVELVNQIQFIKSRTKVSDSELIELNKLIEQFYTQAR